MACRTLLSVSSTGPMPASSEGMPPDPAEPGDTAPESASEEPSTAVGPASAPGNQAVWQYPNAAGHAQQAVLGSGTQYVNFGVSATPVHIAARDPGLIFTATDVMAFTGREWLAREIDDFVDANPCGYVFVEAEAGLGKTAFAAWLVKTRGYLSHFSRYSGGQSVRAALQNLSAQLVMKFGLSELAPGGMLPEWAAEPGGFERVVSKAAEQARASKRRVMLIADGLDEADSPEGGLPFGLPKLLPAGVYVIGTYRTGRTPAQPDAPTWTVRIRKDDPRNEQDIRAFLDIAAGTEVMAGRLAEAGIEPAEFSERLANRCQGVWVYLRYVLQELRIGLRSADAIDDLPAGLRGYYAGQIRLWQQNPGWQDCLLPVLATLGVSGEPLPATALGRLAGNLDSQVMRRLLDLTFRPLLSATRPRSGAPLRYEIYHTSFRQVLRADDTVERPAADGGLSFELEALSDELRQAATAAHCRVADTYLDSFGGLSNSLPVLASSPAAAGADDGYPLRHLVRHLHQAGRSSDLHGLLLASRPLGDDHALNVWFAAHDAADRVVSYLDDLDLGRRISSIATDLAIVCHQPAAALGTEIRYALMAASIASRAARISPALLDLLISSGSWSPERGLDHARRLTDPASRFQGLITVHRHATAAVRAVIAADALSAATATRDEGVRAQALAALGPHLPADQLARALQAAIAITEDGARAQALTALAPQLPPDQQPPILDRALDAAIGIDYADARAAALVALGPHLPADQLARVLEAATAIAENGALAQALTGLAPHLPPDQQAAALDRALDAAIDVGDGEALTGLIPHLPAVLRPAVLARASDAVNTIWENPLRARALTALVPHLPADQQAAVVDRALDAAADFSVPDGVPAIPDDGPRAQALTALAPHLAPGQLGRAVDIAFDIPDRSARIQSLAGLAPYLPADQMARALDAAASTGDDDARAQALTALAPHVPPDQQPAVLARALDAAASTGDDDARAQALTALAPHVPPDQQPAVLARALDAVASTGDDDARAQALTALAPHVPPDQQPRALDAAIAIHDRRHRFRALLALAPYLPPDQLPRALDAAIATESLHLHKALAAVVPRLTADQLARAVDTASGSGDRNTRAQALAALAPHLPADQQPPVLARALDAAMEEVHYGGSRLFHILLALAPHLPADQLPRAFDAAIRIRVDGVHIARNGDGVRAEALAVLASRMSADQQADAVDTATTTSDHDARVRAVIALAPHLAADQMPRALAIAMVAPGSYRAPMLAALAPHLPADQQPAILARALDAANGIQNDLSRAKALIALLSHLPADRQPPVIARALDAAIASAPYNPGHLAALAPHLPADQLARAVSGLLPDIGKVMYPNHVLTALSALAPHLPADQLARVVDAATTIREDRSRANALAALAPHLPADQLARVVDAATAIREDRSRAEALTALAPRLSADQQPAVLAHALDSVTAIHDDDQRTWALTALAPYLPPDQLPRALDAGMRNVKSATAIFTRIDSVLTAAESDKFLDLLRLSLAKAVNRAFCLSAISHLSFKIVESGGVDTARETANGILDTYMWWR